MNRAEAGRLGGLAAWAKLTPEQRKNRIAVTVAASLATRHGRTKKNAAPRDWRPKGTRPCLDKHHTWQIKQPEQIGKDGGRVMVCASCGRETPWEKGMPW